MSDIGQARKALVERILEGYGKALPTERRAAFNNSGVGGSQAKFVDRVATHADRITDDDINAVKRSGLDEDQIFEITVCAAVGQATRQYETAIAALKAVTGKD